MHARVCVRVVARGIKKKKERGGAIKQETRVRIMDEKRVRKITITIVRNKRR